MKSPKIIGEKVEQILIKPVKNREKNPTTKLDQNFWSKLGMKINKG